MNIKVHFQQLKITVNVFLNLFFILAAFRSLKPSPAGVPSDITPQESTDWLEMMWSFAASLVAPDEEEEGIQQLTESLTCKKTSANTNLTPNNEFY